MVIQTGSKTWYVYLLCDPDTEEPFYVGKGTGRRAWIHARFFTSESNEAKKRFIRQIHARGKQVLIKIIAEFHDERDAYIYELAMINLYHSKITNVRYARNGLTQSEFFRIPEKPDTIEEVPLKSEGSNVITDDELAKFLHFSTITIRRLASRGLLPGFKVGGQWRFRREAIEEYIRQQEQQTREQGEKE